jgi:hypothetical protein
MGTKAQLEETQAKSPGVDHWELGWIMLKFKTPLDDDIWDYSQTLMDIKRNIPIYIYIDVFGICGIIVSKILGILQSIHYWEIILANQYTGTRYFLEHCSC